MTPVRTWCKLMCPQVLDIIEQWTLDIIAMHWISLDKYSTCNKDLAQTIIAYHARALIFTFAMTCWFGAFHHPIWSCHCQFMMSHPYHNHYSISKNCAFILFFPWHSSFNIYSFWYQCHRENDSIPRMKSIIHAGFGLHSKRLSPAWSSRGRVSLANHHI